MRAQVLSTSSILHRVAGDGPRARSDTRSMREETPYVDHSPRAHNDAEWEEEFEVAASPPMPLKNPSHSTLLHTPLSTPLSTPLL